MRSKAKSLLVWALASLGFLISYVLTGKGWFYHLFPCFTAFFAAVSCGTLQLWNGQASSFYKKLFIGCSILAFLMVVRVAYMLKDVPAYVPESVYELEHRPRITTFGTDLALATPLSRKIDADWSERDNSDYLARMALRQLPEAGPEDRARLEALIEEAVERKVDYLRAIPSDLVIIDRRGSMIVDYMLTQPRIADILFEYEKVGDCMWSGGLVEYYMRKDR